MKKLIALCIASAAAASLCSFATVAVAAESAARVSGEKMDSGLGELPHYSQWADPTGKNPMQARSASESKQAEATTRRDGKQASRLSVQVSQSK